MDDSVIHHHNFTSEGSQFRALINFVIKCLITATLPTELVICESLWWLSVKIVLCVQNYDLLLKDTDNQIMYEIQICNAKLQQEKEKYKVENDQSLPLLFKNKCV